MVECIIVHQTREICMNWWRPGEGERWRARGERERGRSCTGVMTVTGHAVTRRACPYCRIKGARLSRLELISFLICTTFLHLQGLRRSAGSPRRHCRIAAMGLCASKMSDEDRAVRYVLRLFYFVSDKLHKCPSFTATNFLSKLSYIHRFARAPVRPCIRHPCRLTSGQSKSML